MATRLDRMQAGFYAVFTSEIPNTSVQWSYQQPSYEQLESDVINLQVLSGPTKVYVTRARGTSLLPPTSITLTVPTAIVGALYFISINDYVHSYEAQIGDTVDDIRSALVVNINNDNNDPYTASDTINPGELAITPNSLGSIWQVAKSDNIDLTDLVLSENAVLVTSGTRQATIQIQTFSKSPNPRNGAWSIMEQIQDITETQELVQTLWNIYGIRIIDFGAVSDISAIAGASWESRCSADVTINLDSTFTRPVDSIDAINFNLTTKAPGQLTSWQDSISF